MAVAATEQHSQSLFLAERIVLCNKAASDTREEAGTSGKQNDIKTASSSPVSCAHVLLFVEAFHCVLRSYLSADADVRPFGCVVHTDLEDRTHSEST